MSVGVPYAYTATRRPDHLIAGGPRDAPRSRRPSPRSAYCPPSTRPPDADQLTECPATRLELDATAGPAPIAGGSTVPRQAQWPPLGARRLRARAAPSTEPPG